MTRVIRIIRMDRTNFPIRSTCQWKKGNMTDPWDERYIYLHEIEVDFDGVHVGKYTWIPWIRHGKGTKRFPTH